jgi:hypothetical protein
VKAREPIPRLGIEHGFEVVDGAIRATELEIRDAERRLERHRVRPQRKAGDAFSCRTLRIALVQAQPRGVLIRHRVQRIRLERRIETRPRRDTVASGIEREVAGDRVRLGRSRIAFQRRLQRTPRLTVRLPRILQQIFRCEQLDVGYPRVRAHEVRIAPQRRLEAREGAHKTVPRT